MYTVYVWDSGNRCYNRIASGLNCDEADKYLREGGFLVEDALGKVLDESQDVWNQPVPTTAFRRSEG